MAKQIVQKHILLSSSTIEQIRRAASGTTVEDRFIKVLSNTVGSTSRRDWRRVIIQDRTTDSYYRFEYTENFRRRPTTVRYHSPDDSGNIRAWAVKPVTKTIVEYKDV